MKLLRTYESSHKTKVWMCYKRQPLVISNFNVPFSTDQVVYRLRNGWADIHEYIEFIRDAKLTRIPKGKY